MLNKIIIALLLFLSLYSCAQKDTHGIKIEWLDQLEGDFIFVDKWDYPEGITRNENKQLICDGFCPPEIERMTDNNGNIKEDSIHKYYQYVDTTHLYHSIKSETNGYEWAGTNYITAYIDKSGILICRTMNNAATHSTLEMKITENECHAQIVLNSIANQKIIYFRGNGGTIKIDKLLFEKGILKAEFDLNFENPVGKDDPLWWKGKIHTSIDK